MRSSRWQTKILHEHEGGDELVGVLEHEGGGVLASVLEHEGGDVLAGVL